MGRHAIDASVAGIRMCYQMLVIARHQARLVGKVAGILHGRVDGAASNRHLQEGIVQELGFKIVNNPS
eukprot:CAMPEP_0119556684 /NCGR_PEP_ID=MMETSP1352-20130426/8568_1 /TAXON_ID=265584 /ORGANISM="Stauroneis constricta, Strain CCMP1120" /LENGTH=67 /DNA_ID=CAMNT_0007603671 /DNA_START=1 /DNA_END=200 /DNA_ORIENTATION=+